VVIAPAAADDHNDSGTFSGTFQQGIIVAHSGVTIQSLTIDGNANAAVNTAAGHDHNFRTGITTDQRTNTVYNNTVIDGVKVQGIFRRGIQLYSSAGGQGDSVGNVIENSTISDITLSTPSVPNVGDAIGIFDSNTLVTNNTISNATTGISVAELSAGPSQVTISKNHISSIQTGMNLVALAGGSVIGGPTAADGNTITTPGGGTPATGIAISFTTAPITVQNNTIHTSNQDSAIYVFGAGTSANPIAIIGNTLTATTSDATSTGDGTGIFVTDDPSFFDANSA